MAALYPYLQLTQRLLIDARQGVFNDGDLIAYINVARGQIAGEANCVRKEATLALAQGSRSYPFSSITLASPSGTSGIFHVRMLSIVVATGQRFIRPRPWEWFTLYRLNHPVPQPGMPNCWAQYGQGALGSLYVDPIPDTAYVANLDTTAIPAPLATDSDVEVLPYPWTDAVPFFAAAYALASRPDEMAQKAAASFKVQYMEFMQKARRYANPTVNPSIWEQSNDMVVTNRLAVQPAQRGNG